MNVRILVIEDDANARSVMRESIKLESPRAEVVEESNLLKALDMLSKDSFNLVLLDLLLGDAKDIDAVKLVRMAKPPVPIVAFSGLEDLKEKAIAAGAQDFLSRRDHYTFSSVLWDKCESAMYREPVRPYSAETEPAEIERLRQTANRLREMADEKTVHAEQQTVLNTPTVLSRELNK